MSPEEKENKKGSPNRKNPLCVWYSLVVPSHPLKLVLRFLGFTGNCPKPLNVFSTFGMGSKGNRQKILLTQIDMGKGGTIFISVSLASAF